jgi:hypothetical protein
MIGVSGSISPSLDPDLPPTVQHVSSIYYDYVKDSKEYVRIMGLSPMVW